MHLARQKVQITFFFLERWRSERNKIIALFVVRAILQVKRTIFLSFSDAKAKSTNDVFFLERWRSERNKIIALFVVRAILHVFKRNNFFVLFWCIWQGKKYKWRSFSRKTLRKEQKNCSFCGESHSSCSQKEQFCCPFLMHLARQKVQMTFFSRKVTFRKEQNNCSFCGESKPFFIFKIIALFVVRAMYSKGTICLSFSDAFGKAKSTNDVLLERR